MANVVAEPTLGKMLLKSSIGKKQVMAVTGLALCGFLVPHLTGNFLLFKGEAAFNAYALFLHQIPGFLFIELGLAVMFILHIYLGIAVTRENRKAKSSRYAVNGSKGAKTFASSTMIYTGIILLAFLLIHVIGLRLNPDVVNEPGNVNVYQKLAEIFTSLPYVILYVFASCAVGVHISHGFQSAFQSLGLTGPGFTPFIKKVSVAFGVLLAVGYSSLPIYMYLNN